MLSPDIHYKFDSIKVVSNGERDPDADGAAGASKMRKTAAKTTLSHLKRLLGLEVLHHLKTQII